MEKIYNYNILEIANAFIERGQKEGKHFDVSQINKLVYFFYGCCLGLGFKIKISKAPIAKETGPMFKELLEITVDTNKKPISELLGNGRCAKFSNKPPHDYQLPFDYVYKKFSHMSGKEMSDITHQNDSPWTIATNDGKNLGKEIPQVLIKDNFRNYLKNETTNNPRLLALNATSDEEIRYLLNSTKSKNFIDQKDKSNIRNNLDPSILALYATSNQDLKDLLSRIDKLSSGNSCEKHDQNDEVQIQGSA